METDSAATGDDQMILLTSEGTYKYGKLILFKFKFIFSIDKFSDI